MLYVYIVVETMLHMNETEKSILHFLHISADHKNKLFADNFYQIYVLREFPLDEKIVISVRKGYAIAFNDYLALDIKNFEQSNIDTLKKEITYVRKN